MVDSATDTGHVAGDGRGDPVPVLGRALAIGAQDQAWAVGGEPAVTAGGVAAGEVPEEDEIGCRRRQVREARWVGRVGVPLLGVRVVGAVGHGGVVSQRRGRHPGPLKPRVVSGTDLQSVPVNASRIAVLGGIRMPGPERRLASPSQLDRGRVRAPPEPHACDPHRPTQVPQRVVAEVAAPDCL